MCITMYRWYKYGMYGSDNVNIQILYIKIYLNDNV
jgi:hypothetical protein